MAVAGIRVSQTHLLRIENVVGKGENAGLPAFSLFPIMFSNGLFLMIFIYVDLEVKMFKVLFSKACALR